MRILIAAAALLICSCSTPRVHHLAVVRSHETSACINACGLNRNDCARARWPEMLMVLFAGPVWVENTCTDQYDFCVAACPGVGDAAKKATIAEPPPIQPKRIERVEAKCADDTGCVGSKVCREGACVEP